MIQFNLLPDVKKEYVKAKRTKRLIISTSIIASCVALFFLFTFFSYVNIFQKKHISDLNNDIKTETAKITGYADLNTMLTIQNQINLVDGLHRANPQTSRIFDVMSFVTPKEVKIPSLVLDFNSAAVGGTAPVTEGAASSVGADAASLEISGSSGSIADLNKYVENLKLVKFSTSNSTEPQYLFSGVTTTVNLNEENKTTYKLKMSMNRRLFDNTQDVTLELSGQTKQLNKGTN